MGTQGPGHRVVCLLRAYSSNDSFITLRENGVVGRQRRGIGTLLTFGLEPDGYGPRAFSPFPGKRPLPCTRMQARSPLFGGSHASYFFLLYEDSQRLMSRKHVAMCEVVVHCTLEVVPERLILGMPERWGAPSTHLKQGSAASFGPKERRGRTRWEAVPPHSHCRTWKGTLEEGFGQREIWPPFARIPPIRNNHRGDGEYSGRCRSAAHTEDVDLCVTLPQARTDPERPADVAAARCSR